MASSGEKSLAVGHISGFQIDPKIFKKDFNCLKGMEFIWDLFCDFFPYKSQNRQRLKAMPSWLKLRFNSIKMKRQGALKERPVCVTADPARKPRSSSWPSGRRRSRLRGRSGDRCNRWSGSRQPPLMSLLHSERQIASDCSEITLFWGKFWRGLICRHPMNL